jgi:hypothetical protein
MTHHNQTKELSTWFLKNSPMPHHFTTREEELFKIGTVRIERLVNLLRQGFEGGFEDVALVEVGSVVPGVCTLHASCA